jgi:hypothetical protein
MFSFFGSGTTTTTTTQTESKKENIQEPKEVIYDEEEVNTNEEEEEKPWAPPDLTPEDVTCLINMVSGCARRGVFKINEYEVILPVFRKLCEVARNHPSKFSIVQKPIEVRPPFGNFNSDPKKPKNTEKEKEVEEEVEEEEVKNSIDSPLPRRKKKGKKRRR